MIAYPPEFGRMLHFVLFHFFAIPLWNVSSALSVCHQHSFSLPSSGSHGFYVKTNNLQLRNRLLCLALVN